MSSRAHATPPRLQRQSSVLTEIQESQEKENLGSRCARLMTELSGLCEDRDNVLTSESLEFLARNGRPEAVTLEREPEKPAVESTALPKGSSALGKHDDLLSAEAQQRRQRVEELTRFFMEAKSDIEFALGGSREFRDGRDKDKAGEIERDDDKENETGDDEDENEKEDSPADPVLDAARLHARLLKDKIDERVYNGMLQQIREQDAALYGAILCHPLITGIDAKKDRRKKKKRKERERGKDKASATSASPLSAMLTPDFTAEPLSESDMQLNIARFVARAIADGSLQGLMLAAKLVLSWANDEKHEVDSNALLPLVSHLRVLRGEDSPKVPERPNEPEDINTTKSEGGEVQPSKSETTTDNASVLQATAMELDVEEENEEDASIKPKDSDLKEVEADSAEGEDETHVEATAAVDDEIIDEDALMARAIALSLSSEVNVHEKVSSGNVETTIIPAADKESDNEMPRPRVFSPEEMMELGPFLLPNDCTNVDTLTVVVCLLAQMNKACLQYVESCRKGILPSNAPIQTHPLTFMLLNSLMKDAMAACPHWMSSSAQWVARWTLFASCSMTSMLQVLEAHFFHVEVVAISPASVGLGQSLYQAAVGNRLVESLKTLVERCMLVECDRDSDSESVAQLVFARDYQPSLVESAARCYNRQVRENALAAWARSIAHFYPTQSSRHHILIAMLEESLKVKPGCESSCVSRFHQLDLLCARLCLPDLATGFVPPCGDIVVFSGDTSTSDRTLDATNQAAAFVDDAMLAAAAHKAENFKALWKPELIRASLESGSLSSRILLDFLVEHAPPEMAESTGISALSISDARATDSLAAAYEQMWNEGQKEEQEALECINRLPRLVDLLRGSILRESWISFSFINDYTMPHTPLVPIMEKRNHAVLSSVNARVLLLRALQDLMVQRLGGSRADEPPPLEFDQSRCAETMTLSDGNKTARQYTAKQWGMVMATTGCPPNSGVHEWAVRLDRCEKGHIFLGVCTRDASVATYVGGDRQGWGLIGTRALWHNRSKVRGDYGDGFSTGSVVRVRLNTDSGALSFGVEDGDWGIAFDGLTQHGTLYPAIGLYQRDDQVTLLPVISAESVAQQSLADERGVREVAVPALLHPFLHHSASLLDASCRFLRSDGFATVLQQMQASSSTTDVETLIAADPIILPLVMPLLGALSVEWNYHGLSSILALHFVPWCTNFVRLLDDVNKLLRNARVAAGEEISIDVSGDWEIKSMAAGNIPAQQYQLALTQEKNGSVIGRSAGSLTTVTLSGAVIGTKVRFVETWRQGSTCLVEGRLRADGNSFTGSYEDAKSHISGNIMGRKVCVGEQLKEQRAVASRLVVLEMVSANMVGYFCRFLIDCVSPDLIIENFVAVPSSPDDEIVSENQGTSETENQPKITNECSSDEYEGWVSSMLLSGGLPPATVTEHLDKLLQRLTALTRLELADSNSYPLLAKTTEEWWRYVTPKAASSKAAISSTFDTDLFLQELIDARGEAGSVNRWVTRHVGESPFARLGGEPMKVAKRTVCAAMIWHSGFTPYVKRIVETPHDNLVESEERPHENLMHIWRAAQRVIEWAIRAKNSMGSTYAVIAGLIIRKAQFLLSIEPSAKALTSSMAMSMLSHDSALPVASKSSVYESAERVYSEVLMQVSRFLEAPIRISNLQARMLSHSTRTFLRIAGMRSFRFFVGNVSNAPSSEASQSSFALATVLHWLSPGAVNRSSIFSMSRDITEVSEKSSAAVGVESTHYLNGLSGCGKYLKNDIRDAFEELYGFLCATLSKATWAHDADLQLVILEAWGIVIQPDDHAFLSRVGIFRILQTVLDEARGVETATTELVQAQETRRKVVQATLKVVHLLAAQVAHAGDNAEEYVVPIASATNEVGLGTIPLLRKPSGPETLGKSVFHMLYTELKNGLEDLRTQSSRSTHSFVDAQLSIEPTETEPGVANSDDAGRNDTEEYCYQICSLLYSVSGSPVCRSYLSSSRWLRLLLVLLDVGSVYIQRRTLKLLRRLLPEIDPSSIKLHPQEINALDLDSDDECDEEVDDQAVVLIRFFVGIVGAICPPSLAEAMLRKASAASSSGGSAVEVERYKKLGANAALASEVVLLLRSLYKSAKWSKHLSIAIVGALSGLSSDSVVPAAIPKAGVSDSDVDMDDQNREHPSVESWVAETQLYLEALSALCVLDGHIEGLRVGGTVKILPKAASSAQDVSFRGARGLVVAYEPEKSSAEVLLRSGDPNETSSQNHSSGAMPSRPVRIPIEDLVPVPEVELDSGAFSDEVLRTLLVEKFTFFVAEIRKSLVEFPSSEVLKGMDEVEDVDEDDDMSNDGVSSPGAIDSEMASGEGAESDVESEVASPSSRMSGTTEPLDALLELDRESKLYRMLLCQHGLRAAALLLRDPRAAADFVQGVGSKGLMDLLAISNSETTTAGLSEIASLEESWAFLWSRWFSMRETSAAPPPSERDVKEESEGNQGSNDLLNPMVQQMLEMGFPKEWCEVALSRCNQNVEAAINFCFEHSNDMERFVAQHKGSKENATQRSKGRKTESEPPNPLLEQLAEMGFPLNWCKKALIANRNNVDAALTWILSNGEALEAEDRRDEESKLLSTSDQVSVETPSTVSEVKPNPLRAVSGQASIGEADMMVEGLVGGGFASVGAPDCVVSSGRWYYEAILHTNGCIQIGWADVAFCGAADRGDGVGDGVHSWAYDGWRQQKWHGQSSPWGCKWKQGDVVGCAVDADAGTVIFSLNGKMRSINMGIAFRGIEYSHGIYPCASFNRRERLQFNLGGTPFKFQPPPGFLPILDVLNRQFDGNNEIPRGFAVIGSREDCLEESIGDETYTSDSRYFGRDLHPSMLRSNGSHSRTNFMNGSTRADMFAELKAIPDDRIFAELLVLTRSLAILYARRAVLTMMSKWPAELVGSFSMKMFSASNSETPCGDDARRYLDFVKLIAGVSTQLGSQLSSNDSSCAADIDELLECGASGRLALSLMHAVTKSSIRNELSRAGTNAEISADSLTVVVLDRIGEEVKNASQRQYARVPWDSIDATVAASLMQISAENGQPWSDKEVRKHPNLFLAEWLTRLVLDALDAHSMTSVQDDLFESIRSKLLNAWILSLRSAGQCVKEKGFVIVAGILQEMVMKISGEDNMDMKPKQHTQVLEAALQSVSLKRIISLAEDRLLKEYPQVPVCSRYLQSIIELVSAGSLAYSMVGKNPDHCFNRDIRSQQIAARKLEEDLSQIDATEYEEEALRRQRLAEDAEAQAKQAGDDSAIDVVDNEGENDDQVMQETDNSPSHSEGVFGTSMEIDSEAESGTDITLSAIANMVAEDSDVVAAAAAIAAAAKGRLTIRQTDETIELKSPATDFEYVFPEPSIDLDTSMLLDEEVQMLRAGKQGIIGEEALSWEFGPELGVMSDTCSNLWSGQLTQFRLRSEEHEPVVPELTVGCKVIRGPNWKWRDQDGGDGSVGVVEGLAPWSDVEGEGMSIRWPNGSLYTYRWGADGNYDLIHVEADDDGTITHQYPIPKAKQDDEGVFGCELHMGILLHLYESDAQVAGKSSRVAGIMEFPDFNAAVRIAGMRSEDQTLCLQELILVRGNPDMGWMLRFGTEKWQAGTKYTLRPASTADGVIQSGLMVGEFTYAARKKATIVQVSGEIRVTTKHFFKMDPYNHFSTLTISEDDTVVTCNGGESRNLAIATIGFAVGVHYWEVRVDQAEFGSVFIGVCEKAGPPGSQAALSNRLNRWHGWGFVNFRATYHNSTERIYGDHFNAGDTIGVRLDMEQGKLSFFMDGMKFGEHIVADLGVAFENMKGERNSRTLYPCIGMRKSGDRVALNGKWMSVPGVSPRQQLRDAVDVSQSLHSWMLHVSGIKTSGPVQLSEQLLKESWREWKRWSENRWQRYPVRPRGVLVDFDTLPASCIAVSNDVGLAAPFLAGDRVRVCAKLGRELNQPEEAVILGVYRNHLWYRTETQGNEGADEGRSWAWYFSDAELAELLLVRRNGKDMTLIENSATDLSEVLRDTAFVPRSEVERRAKESFAAFVQLATQSHTPASDMQLVERLNTYCASVGVDMTNLKMGDVVTAGELEDVASSENATVNRTAKRTRTQSVVPDDYFAAPSLKTITGPELRARCAVLRVLNGKLSRALPLVALQTSDTGADSIQVQVVNPGTSEKHRTEYLSTGVKIRTLRRLIFTATKRAFWDAVLRATTTSTPLPSDEYEDPREIRVIRINRIQAQPSKLSLLAQPSDRLRRSVFGQLYREMRSWNDSSFRRAYCGKGHGGQRRAFKVKFLGEGVNDYGGPYRAVFEQVVDELQMDNVELSKGEQGLLPLLIPCPNRRSGTGSNQDKYLLNPSCGTSLLSNGPMALDLHRFLGKVIGTAVRHGLQMGLDLPLLVWRPLARLDVNRAHLESVDVVAANNFTRIEECDPNEAEETLGYLTFSTTLSDGSEVALCPNGAQTPVTFNSRQQFVHLAEKMRLTESATQLAALREGLSAVLPMELAPLFTPRELEVLICGRREVDVELLQQCTEYGEGMDPTMPHVVAFWDVLREMSSDERTSFLRFVWARSRMPNSAKDFPMNFKLQSAHDMGAQVDPDIYLPHAQTCFFALRLPTYSSKDVLRNKLLYAIQNSPNMDADVRLHNAEGWADA